MNRLTLNKRVFDEVVRSELCGREPLRRVLHRLEYKQVDIAISSNGHAELSVAATDLASRK